MRNILSHVPKAMQAMAVKAMAAAMIRTIFVQPDLAAARVQLAKVAESLERRFPWAS